MQFSFAARPGVCGNGRTYYSTGPGNYNGVFYNDGYRTEPCVPGPVRVVIDRADKLPLSVQTFVGPADSSMRGVTDLGTVRAQDAADYLLSLASTVDGRAGRDAISPAMLADSAGPNEDMRSLSTSPIQRTLERRASSSTTRNTPRPPDGCTRSSRTSTGANTNRTSC